MIEFSEKEEEVFSLIDQYGDVDGAHHKQWLLDQCMRVLLRNEYSVWFTERYQKGYDWDQGVAP